MTRRRIRVLLAKMGEGHNRSQLNLAKSLSDGGFEVVYTELQEPEAIVDSALQEGVDHIGITTLPGTDTQAFAEITRLLREREAEYITVTAGGIMDDEKVSRLKEMGITAFFPEGTTFDEIVKWSQERFGVNPA